MSAAAFRAEAERQAREGLKPHPFITHCGDCRKPFTFGAFDSEGVNVYSMDGARECQITGTCESCFDSYFEGDEDDAEEVPC